MDVLGPHQIRGLFLALLTGFISGCQIGYYAHSAYNQSKLYNEREPIDKVLRGSRLTEEQKHKLRLVQQVKEFAETTLKLRSTRNYTTYVQLDRPYVTYVVQAASANELKPYLWHFPLVGDVPYKGYFDKKMADDEAATFDKTKYDTFVRGVSAYSTLGWFEDSVLSSMLRYEDYDLVETIIHETVHATLYIHSAAEFNERMATFMGEEGMKLFYQHLNGDHHFELTHAEDNSHDQKLFSEFLTREIENLKVWYSAHKVDFTTELKKEHLLNLQQKFSAEVAPKLKTTNYRAFAEKPLNNALILAYQTYEYSLQDFQKLYDHFGRDYQKTLSYLKTLESDPHPDQTLKAFVSKFPALDP